VFPPRAAADLRERHANSINKLYDDGTERGETRVKRGSRREKDRHEKKMRPGALYDDQRERQSRRTTVFNLKKPNSWDPRSKMTRRDLKGLSDWKARPRVRLRGGIMKNKKKKVY